MLFHLTLPFTRRTCSQLGRSLAGREARSQGNEVDVGVVSTLGLVDTMETKNPPTRPTRTSTISATAIQLVRRGGPAVEGAVTLLLSAGDESLPRLCAAPPLDICQRFRRSSPGSSTLVWRTSLRLVERVNATTPIATTPMSDAARTSRTNTEESIGSHRSARWRSGPVRCTARGR